MESSLWTPVPLLSDWVELTQGCASELSSRYNPLNPTRPWIYLLPGHMAVRPSNACLCIYSRTIPGYAGAFPTKVSCLEIFKARIQWDGYNHYGRESVEDLKRNLQSWLQREPFNEPD